MHRKKKRLKWWNRQKRRWNVNGDKPGIDEMNRRRKRLKERNNQKGNGKMGINQGYMRKTERKMVAREE